MFRSFGRNWFEYGNEGQTFTIGKQSLNGGETNYMYRNEGDGTFTSVAWAVGTASRGDSRGTTAADFDRDGDLDILLTNNNGVSQYFENRAPRGHWLTVQLRGSVSNPLGIGARLRAKVGGRWLTRELQAGAGYLSSPPPEVHFGLGDATEVERLEVRWPTGVVQALQQVPGDQVLVVQELEATRAGER